MIVKAPENGFVTSGILFQRVLCIDRGRHSILGVKDQGKSFSISEGCIAGLGFNLWQILGLQWTVHSLLWTSSGNLWASFAVE